MKLEDAFLNRGAWTWECYCYDSEKSSTWCFGM